jgi:hypothetical protein
MAREGSRTGTVKIRQVYSKEGRNYCALTIPIVIMDLMGWAPGDVLAFYPTDSGGVKGLGLVRQADWMTSLMPDFDREAVANVTRKRGPRPGSIAAQEIAVDDRMQAVLREIDEKDAARMKKAGSRVKTWVEDGFVITEDPDWREKMLTPKPETAAGYRIKKARPRRK